jgi:plastocyanin
MASSTASEASASSASSSSASTGSGGGEPAIVNGCDESTALDLTGQAAVTIEFPSGPSNDAYDPACIKVSAGTAVTFTATTASFTSHPLRGGTVTNGTAIPDPTSVIQSVDTGTSATFTMSTTGARGYYCEYHYYWGMMGAIFVEP